MTKQNKIMVQLGPVQITSDRRLIPPENEKPSLNEILIDFINVNAENPDEIDNYCKNTGYTPSDWSKGFDYAFKQEQDLVKKVVSNLIKDELSNDDIELVAFKLRNVEIKLKVISENELEKLNKDLFQLSDKKFSITLDPEGRKKYLIPVTHYKSRIESIWGSLYNHIRTKRSLRQCKDVFRCRRFFVPNKYKPSQQHCTPECEDRYRKQPKNSP